MSTQLNNLGVTFPDATTQTSALPAWGTTGNVLTSNGNAWISSSGAVNPPVNQPTNVSPGAGASSIGQTPALTGSAYSSDFGLTMGAGQWQVSTVSNFATTVIDTGDVAGTDVTYSVSSGILAVSTQYFWRCRYKSTTGAYSAWSTATSFTTASSFGPTTPGQAFGGGYYAGKINQGGTQYYLIVAPLASGQAGTGLQWKTTNTTTPGTTSVIDGPANSAAMNNANHPAAQYCEGLTIGGFSDWYLPAKNELEVCYYFLKPDMTSNYTASGANPDAVAPEPISTNYTGGSPARTSVTAFQTGGTEAFIAGSYWSSTEDSATYAWKQGFNDGYQVNFSKNGGFYVRAVRRVAV